MNARFLCLAVGICGISLLCALYACKGASSAESSDSAAYAQSDTSASQEELAESSSEDYDRRRARAERFRAFQPTQIRLAKRLRKANSSWLKRFGRFYEYDVSYDFSILLPSSDGNGPLQEVSRQSFRTVYDRGLDFLPASEHAIYGLILPIDSFSGSVPDVGSVRVVRWESAKWPWPSIWQYGLPSPLLHLGEIPYGDKSGTGTLDVAIDDETGLVLRELFWFQDKERRDLNWHPGGMRTYTYGEGREVPKETLLYGGYSETMAELPLSVEEWWKLTERIRKPECRNPYRWRCEIVGGLFFVTRVEFLEYGTDEIVRVHELQNISVTKREDSMESLRDMFVRLGIYSEFFDKEAIREFYSEVYDEEDLDEILKELFGGQENESPDA